MAVDQTVDLYLAGRFQLYTQYRTTSAFRFTIGIAPIGTTESGAVSSALASRDRDNSANRNGINDRYFGRNSLMPDKERTEDRREHKRYFAKNRLFAVIRSNHYQLKKIENMSKGEIAFALLKSNPSKMGEIIEISRGGLSFHYIANEKDLKALDELDIIFVEKGFHLSRLPFKAVEDAEVIDDSPFNALDMKRLTVKFEELSPKQKQKIDHLLHNYTTGEVSNKKSKQAWGNG
jgi:hypothetical protein